MLPPEILCTVFGFLDARTLLMSVPGVCKQWAAVCRDNVADVDLGCEWAAEAQRARLTYAALLAMAKRFRSVGRMVLDRSAPIPTLALGHLLRTCSPRELAVQNAFPDAETPRQLPAGELRGLYLCCPALQCLKYACFQLESLPAEIGQLTGLHTLDLSCCYWLGSLPAEIGQLAALQNLDLSQCNSLAALPAEIGQLTALQALYLSHCEQLVSLPAEIGQLTSLQALYLEGCDQLAALPAAIGQLAALQILDLSECHSLAALPAAIEQLPSLLNLNLVGSWQLESDPVAQRLLAAIDNEK